MCGRQILKDLLDLVEQMNKKVFTYANEGKIERGAQLNEDVNAILGIVEKYVKDDEKVVDKN